MGRINILPRSVAELIAAGEVVDRPSAIVKELVENAIDAGADRITVELKNGGVSYIRVTDNGIGMSREDVATAFIRHATSKISDADDLNGIATLGFRGEALPSIAAVSRVKVTTRTADDP
ncbi:MAG: ATP-binding protein, partial [Oscillospiraceae bacterium]|nr:ATP-binding protein [Oscillospiraceae bacterium]